MSNLTLKRSTGVNLFTTLHPDTVRQIVKKGDAIVITPGVSGYDVVQLVTPALDTTYSAASPANPVKHVVGDSLFLPLQVPESIVHT